MPLLNEEPKLPAHRLLKIELPLFFLALLISVLIHQVAHNVVYRKFCAGNYPMNRQPSAILETHTDCPEAAIAGVVATFLTAVASFAIYIRNSNILFFGSAAFINATIRLPETIAVFLQMLLRQKTDLNVDESIALRMLHMHDPAVAILILCFFSLTIFFLAITIIHDTMIIPSKWAIAACLFALIIPLDVLLRRMIEPMLL
jgi:hypothetical protein